MKGYQADIDHFAKSETQVLGISVDTQPSQKVFAEQIGVQFPLLSDFPHKQVSKLYGVLDEQRGFTRRVTFVIDKQGAIRRIDSGQAAMDITGVKDTCTKLD